MDREKLGASVVDSVIATYKDSQEFHDDAVKHVKDEIINHINAEMVTLGEKYFFGKSEPSDMEEFDTWRNRKEIINETFTLIFSNHE